MIETTYDIKTVQTRNKYLTEARKLIQEELDIDEMRQTFINRLDALSELAESNGKVGEAIKAVTEQAKLLGLYVDKQEIKVDIDTYKIKFGE